MPLKSLKMASKRVKRLKIIIFLMSTSAVLLQNFLRRPGLVRFNCETMLGIILLILLAIDLYIAIGH